MIEPLKIGLTACGNYHYYHEWFVHETGVEIVKLDNAEGNLAAVEMCDGIVFTGGQDIHPRYYHKEISDIPNATAIDEARDAFEWKLLEYVQQRQVPLLGICRGLQLVNVFLGGSLILDIPTAGKSNHSKISNLEDRYHALTISPDSRLKSVVGATIGEVNSAHHQGVDVLGRGLRAAAYSNDGIIEAVEPESPEHSSYMLLVQWHPERMNDQSSPLSGRIKSDFLNAVGQVKADVAAQNLLT